MAQKKVIICSEITNPNWKWVTHHFSDDFDWTFCRAKTSSKSILTIFYRVKACINAALKAKNADAIVSHGPYMAFYCAVFLWLFRIKTPHVTYSFNFAEMPRGFALQRMQFFFKKINSLVVSSTMERELYSEYFGIPIGQLDFVLWGVAEPEYELKPAQSDRAYISTVGGNARDYKTFMAAMAELPEHQAIAVMRPHNLVGLNVPENVKVLVNTSKDEALSIIKHSTLSVLPLSGSETPCGHVTIVVAMYLGVPCIVTDSSGVSDYIDNGETGFLVGPSSSESMKSAIRKAFGDDELRSVIAQNSERFAQEKCSEINYKQHFTSFLSKI